MRTLAQPTAIPVDDQLSRFLGHDVVDAQRAVCARYGVEYHPARPDQKIGINLADAGYPLNGLREPLDPEFDSLSGWWIWNGERDIQSLELDAMHVAHLGDRCLEALPYLGLPPG